MTASVLALAVLGLNLGIDFKGGTQIGFETPQPTSLADVRIQAAKIGQGNAVIQGRGPSTNEEYKSFQIRTETLTTDESAALTADLKKTVNADAFGIKNVSASFGRQIAKGAILAIIVSLLLIVGYISLRFQWQFAVPAIVALVHDILITVGVYALLGREVSTATVAAVLTVLGYSIYDTIIIFDRIRENLPLMKRASMRQITNVSLWETIPRSLATTFITLLPVVSLLIFGGATLNDFAFALLIGIGSGAYSSIFVAAPLLDWIKEREPEYARRKHDEVGAIQSVGGTILVDPAAATLVVEAEELLAPEPVAEDAGPAEARRRRRPASAGAPAARAARTAARGRRGARPAQRRGYTRGHGRQRLDCAAFARATRARRSRLGVDDGRGIGGARRRPRAARRHRARRDARCRT